MKKLMIVGLLLTTGVWEQTFAADVLTKYKNGTLQIYAQEYVWNNHGGFVDNMNCDQYVSQKHIALSDSDQQCAVVGLRDLDTWLKYHPSLNTLMQKPGFRFVVEPSHHYSYVGVTHKVRTECSSTSNRRDREAGDADYFVPLDLLEIKSDQLYMRINCDTSWSIPLNNAIAIGISKFRQGH